MKNLSNAQRKHLATFLSDVAKGLLVYLLIHFNTESISKLLVWFLNLSAACSVFLFSVYLAKDVEHAT